MAQLSSESKNSTSNNASLSPLHIWRQLFDIYHVYKIMKINALM